MSGSPRAGVGWKGSRLLSWRMLLSALAGGGLSAAGLGGPVAALGAEEPAGSTTSTESSPPPTTTTPEGGSEGTGTTTQGTGTTTGTTTPTTPAPSASAPSTPAPSAGAPQATGPAPSAVPPPSSGEAPKVVLRRPQGASAGGAARRNGAQTKTQSGKTSSQGTGAGANVSNNVALAPQLVAAQASALAAELSGQAASAQALDFYRIPLFLLPIYRAAAEQYDVPWQILAAINEIETDYGTDLSVSSAGAVGWMQFMPQTWLEYGVDALNAGYADPYNPVDAIFAAARYLNAAGAAQNLDAAILAYNHSEAYVSSVLLRAKLIAAYPGQVIATLTGLVDDRPPVTGKRIGWGAPALAAPVSLPSSSTATAGASAVKTPAAAAAAGTPGSTAAPSPASAATAASTTGSSPELVDVTSEPKAHAVAVQDGRIVKLGTSRALGRYVVLQDVYGDTFTYADLARIASSYLPTRADSLANGSPKGGSGGAVGRAPVSTASGSRKARVFAHPGNPDALVAARARAASARSTADPRRPLRGGSVVAQGTVLGRVSTPPGAVDGHLRFAIKPAGDSTTIDPRAILQNWSQLATALHPRGAKGNASLLGATASDVFLLSKSQLEREVLADPGIAMSACSRQQVAAGKVDKRVLAVLGFLSRSGLKPTIGTLACGNGAYAASGFVSAGHDGDAAAIVAINGVPIAGHQGAGSITDTTIRTLLTLQKEFFPARIVSLMRYPGAPTTMARADHGDYIEVVFTPAPRRPRLAAAATAAVARSARSGKTAPAPVAVVGGLSATQWEQLISRVGALPQPKVSAKPSSSAIPDRKKN